MFRHGYRGAFPTRKSCTSVDFKQAVKKMKEDKNTRCSDINKSIKRRAHSFKTGQWVYVRNRVRNKFDPLFYEEPWIIESVEKNGVILLNAQLTKRKIRHVDDIKPYIALDNEHVLNTTPTQTKPSGKTFYSLPSNNDHNDLQSSASLPLGDVIVQEVEPEAPERSIAADRPQRKCKRSTSYKDFY